ncbi:MAG: UDP-glucose/GDP-mannose dehydrogenase family protein [Candidatus Bathyarchaeota archaeon]|nr:MAG: UDP-glucose/GDP-mannose dehydrogenase family protein [Candidatus Bathyarchaeota archaeon]
MRIGRISIVGTGYVGLVTAVGFASKGYMTIASTHDPEKVALINSGVPPFYELGLGKIIEGVVKDGHLKCVLYKRDVILDTDVTFVAAGTPSRQDGSIDLQYVERTAEEIGQALREKRGYHLVVVKSTVVPGTTERIVKPTIERHSGKKCGTDFGLCMNPEFLREGSALQDTLHPDRIIIGEVDKRSGDLLESIYQEFYGVEMPPTIRTNPSTAELVKYANNAFLATKISFMNSIANICEGIPGVDVKDVAEAIGIDKRISSLFLNAGLGFGGSCLPKDVKALISFSKNNGYEPVLLEAIEEVNRAQPDRAVELAEDLVGDLKGKQIAILGLAFKPETDDMREATSLKIINRLLKKRGKVVAYDPMALSKAKEILGDKVSYASSAIDCIKDAVCCILVTEWDEFKKLEPHDFVKYMKEPNVIDGRRIFDPRIFAERTRFKAIGLG